MRKLVLIAVVGIAFSSCSTTGTTTTTVPATGTPPPRPDTLTVAPPAPEPRRAHTLTLVAPGELLVTGGLTYVGNSSAWLGDTWIFQTGNGSWSQLGDISVRGQHTVATSGDTTLVYGGYAGTNFVYGDLRARVRKEWIDIVDSSRPAARAGAVMAYDEESELFVLFGGDVAPFDARLPTNETWVLNMVSGRWELRSPEVSPRPKSEGHPTLFELALVYDEAADRLLLLIGGDELWAYDTNTNTWEERAEPGLDADFMVAAAYHAGIDRLITYGGAPTSTSAETWSYDYATDVWELIATDDSPGPLADHAMAYDPWTDLIYLYGGTTEVLSLGDPPVPSGEMWAFDGSQWALIDATSVAPMP